MDDLTLPTPPRGVQFNSPPPHLLGDVNAAIASAIDRAEAQLAAHPEKHTAIVAVADLTGANAALVVKVDNTWEVKAYIGKEWKGPLSAGAELLALF